MTNAEMAKILNGLAEGNEIIASMEPRGEFDSVRELEAKAERAGAEALLAMDQRKREECAQAVAAGLREALALTNHCGALDGPMWTAWKEANSAALARTPAQHRGRIVAEGFKQAGEMALAVKVNGTIDTAASIRDFIGDALIAHGERLEKEAGNGIHG